MREHTTDIESIILKDGVYVSTSAGVSMMPMLRDRRDTIVVEPVTERLKKYDVALYRRGEDYVLHRVIKVLPDSYVIRGDNCMAKEYGITDREIIGKLTAFYRKDNKIDMSGRGYRAYSVIICAAHPIIYCILGVRGVFRRLFGKKHK